MNKNNINFQVHRTKEGTICEVVSGLLLLISLILCFIMLSQTPEGAAAMFIQTGTTAIGVVLILCLAYFPKTFNVPDDSPAEVYVATIRFVRIVAVLMSLLALSITTATYLSLSPTLPLIGFGIIFVPALAWYLYVCWKAKKSSHPKL
jgi:hypothetical protein